MTSLREKLQEQIDATCNVTQTTKLQANKCYGTMAVSAPTKESIPRRVTPVGARSSEQMTHKGSAATQTTKVTSK